MATMINLQFEQKQAVLSFPQELLTMDYVQTFLERLKLESLLEKSQLTEEQAFSLSEEIQENWWNQHKQNILAKIENYNS
jgi:hypothetical protein